MHSLEGRSIIMAYAIWIGMSVAVIAATHYYIWARLVRDPVLPRGWYFGATMALIVLAVSLPAAMIMARLWHAPVAKVVVWGAYTWLGLMFLLIAFLAAADILQWLSRGVAKVAAQTPEEIDAGRRVLLARLWGGGVALGALASAGWAAHGALGGATVIDVPVTLKKWPKALDGLKIVQLSDVHVGVTMGREALERIVRQVNAQKPDVVVITGDLVDGSVRELGPTTAVLGDLQARYGVFFVTGNHEYYSGAPAWCTELTRLGIRVLRNERVLVGEGEASFYLAGVDDATAHRYTPGHGADYEAALGGVDGTKETILLAHQPKAVYEAEKYGVGLVLSGHTHGGQIFPFGALVRLTQPYLSGLNRHNDATQVYVSCGTGFWGPPMRLGAPAEITGIRVHAPNAAQV